MTKPSTSLNKYISQTGMCSRREADRWIDAGRVKINDAVAQKGNRVFENDVVSVDGEKLFVKKSLVYIALNKPAGITCTTDLSDRDNIINFVGHEKRIFPIGRLDKPSTGLILLTNDGDIVNKILRSEYNHEKEYVVSVDKVISKNFVRKMANGLPILGTVTKNCLVEQMNKKVFRIILTQGLNRQIRRMCEHLGYNVVTLKRTRIMNIHLQKTKIGQWRNLSKEELKQLKSHL